MIVNSMTGFASMSGAHEVWTWAWEMRSVNARGLDVRLRLPDGFDDLDPYIRETVKAAITRGNVSIGLKLRSDSGTNTVSLSEAALDKYIADCQVAEAKALEAGLNLAPLTGADLLSAPGVMQSGGTEAGLVAVKAQAKAQIPQLLDAFNQARAGEGAAMAEIFGGQVDQIESLAERARVAAAARQEKSGDLIRERVKLLLDTTDLADEARLQQELAIITVKADVTEELDRLDAHVTAARALIRDGGAVGRKLDFLMQELRSSLIRCASKFRTWSNQHYGSSFAARFAAYSVLAVRCGEIYIVQSLARMGPEHRLFGVCHDARAACW